MNAPNDAILMIARGGMELTWRYAWAWFLIQLAIRKPFPLPVAVFAFLLAAVFAQLTAGRNWRVYQKLLLQVAGFALAALWVVHRIQYHAMPFFSLDWIDRLWGAQSIGQWFFLILTLYCLWIIWQGGQILVRGSSRYAAVHKRFDLGLGLLFLLLITKAFVESRVGVHLPGRDSIFLTLAFFVFGLTSLGIARNQGDVKKSFLSGHHGLGVILGISTVATLLGTGTVLLVYPYLHSVADTLLSFTKAVARPMEPVLVKTLLWMFRPRGRYAEQQGPHQDTRETIGMDDANLTDGDPHAVEGWEALMLQVAGWGILGVIGLGLLVVLGFFLIYVIRWLLKRSPDDAVRPVTIGFLGDWLRKVVELPLRLWRAWTSLLKGFESAATVYVEMLRWGRRSGVISINSETPCEYGNRLKRGFPGLDAEIEQIVDAFNKEVYGQATTDRETLSCLRFSLRCMKGLRHWPSRIRMWFLQ